TDRRVKELGQIVSTPTTGRYHMSMAHHLLCRMKYGLTPLHDATSWRRYEVIVAEYVRDLVDGLNTRPARDLMLQLGVEQKEDDKPFTGTLSFKSVTVVHCDESVMALEQDVAASSDGGRAHMVVYAPGVSPLGDVVVILPGVAVICIRCRFDVEGAVSRESKRCGTTKQYLGALAKVRKGAELSIRVLAASEGGSIKFTHE
ncbi:Hypothetical protein, putative, partial [Bodo saltans]